MKVKQWNENILNIKEKYFRHCMAFKHMSFASISSPCFSGFYCSTAVLSSDINMCGGFVVLQGVPFRIMLLIERVMTS